MRFDPDRHAGRLESPARYRRQPPELILPYLPADEKGIIVELGCGSGYFGRVLARFHRHRLYIGLDPSEVMLERFSDSLGQAFRHPVALVRTEKEVLPLKSGLVSLLVMTNVLHEITSDAGVIKEIDRILAPGGHLFVVDWKKRPSRVGPPIFMRVSRSKAMKIFEGLGYRSTVVPPVYSRHYCLLFAKPGS